MFMFLKDIFNFNYSKYTINFFKIDYCLDDINNDENSMNNNINDKSINYNPKCNYCKKNIINTFYMYNDNIYCSDSCRFTLYNMNNKNY